MRWTPEHAPAQGVQTKGPRALLWLTGALMVAALVFGGASRQNLLQISGLELLSLPLLWLAVLRLTTTNGWRRVAAPAAILAVAAAIPLLQLIPMPFELWARLPGRAAAAQALTLAGLGSGWRPLSLTPIETWRHVLALLPPTAVFLAACTLRDSQRRWLSIIFPIGAAVSLLMGVAQLAGGSDSTLYVYAKTNWGSAVGFFANRNHQAALLVASLPFAALWIDLGRRDRRQTLLSLAAVGSVFLIEIVGLIVVQSRAGVLLLVPALFASLLLVWRQGQARVGRRGVALLGAVIVAALAAGIAFGSGPVMARFKDSGDGRFDTAPVAARAAVAHMPFGGGVGAFPQVYASVEPVRTMNSSYWNHAHNEYLEIWLDAGLLGVGALLAFLVWWGSRVWAAWRAGPSLSGHLARIGSVATGLLLIHSAVDYPLRTLALACLFAFACALMTPAPASARTRVNNAR
jgi:O-antigen ligase